MILFNQLRQGLQRFDRVRFQQGYIDTGCAVIKSSLIGETKWDLGIYEADFFFLNELKAKTQSIKNIPLCLSYYINHKNLIQLLSAYTLSGPPNISFTASTTPFQFG